MIPRLAIIGTGITGLDCAHFHQFRHGTSARRRVHPLPHRGRGQGEGAIVRTSSARNWNNNSQASFLATASHCCPPFPLTPALSPSGGEGAARRPSARPLECGDSSFQPGGLPELSRGQRPRKQPPITCPPRSGGGTLTPAALRGASPFRPRPGALPPAKFRWPSGPGIVSESPAPTPHPRLELGACLEFGPWNLELRPLLHPPTHQIDLAHPAFPNIFVRPGPLPA